VLETIVSLTWVSTTRLLVHIIKSGAGIMNPSSQAANALKDATPCGRIPYTPSPAATAHRVISRSSPTVQVTISKYLEFVLLREVFVGI
jgi:hypothetical protein